MGYLLLGDNMENVIVPVLEAAGLIKVVTWIKLTYTKLTGKEISGYIAWILVFVVAIAWKVAYLLFTHSPIDAKALVDALILAGQAVIGYGAANLGLFGQPGKDIVNKPLL